MDYESMPDWIILQQPGMVPKRKGPYLNPEHLETALRELYALYPDCVCTVIRMPDTSYPESGREWLSINATPRQQLVRE